MTLSPPAPLTAPAWLQQGLVYTRIRLANRWLLYENLLLALVLVICACVGLKGIANLLAGPVRLDRSTLLALRSDDLPFLNFVTVPADGNSGPWLREISVSDRLERWDAPTPAANADPFGAAGLKPGESEWVRYSILFCGGRYLLARQQRDVSSSDPLKSLGLTVSGMLEPIPAALAERLPTSSGFPERVLPVILDIPTDRSADWGILLLGVALFGLAAWNVVKAKRRFARPETHPIACHLRRYGDFILIATAIEHEISDPATCVRTPTVVLTRSWLLVLNAHVLQSARLEELVWVHRKETRRSVYCIPIGRSHALCFYTRTGQKFEATTSAANVEPLIGETTRRALGILVGYRSEIAAAWKSDRASLVRWVDEARWNRRY